VKQRQLGTLHNLLIKMTFSNVTKILKNLKRSQHFKIKDATEELTSIFFVLLCCRHLFLTVWHQKKTLIAPYYNQYISMTYAVDVLLTILSQHFNLVSSFSPVHVRSHRFFTTAAALPVSFCAPSFLPSPTQPTFLPQSAATVSAAAAQVFVPTPPPTPPPTPTAPTAASTANSTTSITASSGNRFLLLCDKIVKDQA
jgi:hypothetical protein